MRQFPNGRSSRSRGRSPPVTIVGVGIVCEEVEEVVEWMDGNVCTPPFWIVGVGACVEVVCWLDGSVCSPPLTIVGVGIWWEEEEVVLLMDSSVRTPPFGSDNWRIAISLTFAWSESGVGSAEANAQKARNVVKDCILEI